MAWLGLDLLAGEIGGTRDDAYRVAMGAVPLGRMAQPEEIAGTVAWLLSPMRAASPARRSTRTAAPGWAEARPRRRRRASGGLTPWGPIRRVDASPAAR